MKKSMQGLEQSIQQEFQSLQVKFLGGFPNIACIKYIIYVYFRLG